MNADRRPALLRGRRLALAAVLAGVPACLAAGRGGELESRFATVHNALSAIGMSEIGALHETRLETGQEGKIDLELAVGCTTIVAVGAASIVDLDAALVDAAGTRLARGTAHTSEATIRACNDMAGTYSLKLKAARGSGPVLVSTWSGGAPTDPALAGRPGDPNRTVGTCDAPLPLSAGEFSGTTVHGEHLNESKGCQNTSAAELVYKLELASREKVLVAVETEPRFDSVIYIRKGDCSDAETEVACNDDAPPPGGTDKDQRHSRIEQVLDAGTYYVFVDGYSGKGGSFKMHVELADVPPLAELCSKAPMLADATPSNGTTEGAFDNVSATCGEGAHGPDSIYALSVAQRSRVRVVVHADDFSPVVHVRSRCDDPATTVGCADSGGADHEATFLDILDPGTYMVFADSSQRDANGKFTVTADTSPEIGSGVRGERCRDAIPLSRSELTVTGDTFAARDDVSGQCGGTGAPDVVYRLDVPSRTRFTAHLGREEGTHVLVLLRGCEGAKSELDCGKAVDKLLGPGTYFLAVDGDSPASFGKFTFDWNTRDTHAQDVACKAVPRLREGETVNATTLGGVDKFSPSCAAADTNGGAPDLVYEVVLVARPRVHLRLHTGGWGGVLSVRRACVEGDTAAVTASEVECRPEDGPDVEFDSVLDAGKYYVVVDGKEPSSSGPFTLEYSVSH